MSISFDKGGNAFNAKGQCINEKHATEVSLIKENQRRLAIYNPDSVVAERVNARP